MVFERRISLVYPIGLNLTGRPCLVVGGGEVARRKVEGLVAAGAAVRVVSPELSPALTELVRAGRVQWEARPFRTGDLDGSFLVVAATDDQAVNETVFREAESQGKLVNVVDDPPRCNFILPAVVRRGSLCLAVFTCGKSPMLSRNIREELERQFGPEYEDYVDLLGEARELILRTVADPSQRTEIFRRLVYSDLLEVMGGSGRESAWAQVLKIAEQVAGRPIEAEPPADGHKLGG